jgi:hypothetical protein
MLLFIETSMIITMFAQFKLTTPSEIFFEIILFVYDYLLYKGDYLIYFFIVLLNIYFINY